MVAGIPFRKKVMSQNYCPICYSLHISPFLRRNGVPIFQNLVISDQETAEVVPRGDLTLAVCNECGFFFNQTFDPTKVGYGQNYDNTQTHSPLFIKYVEGLVDYLVFERGIKNCQIVEVGCGKGLFLRKLVQVQGSGNRGYGFDPSYTGPEIDLEGRLKFERHYYGSKNGEIAADVVICRHVIEHVPDPLTLLSTIKQALVHSPQAKVFFETPCGEWILYHRVFWDFFYEHCSYFTADSLTTAFEATGFRVENIRNVFEKQYLWLEATANDQKPFATKRAGNIPHLAKEFAESEHELKKVLQERVRTFASQGGVALWGAGAKGVTLANLIDPGRHWIACVVDLNPEKQGHYIPGTGHPIVGYQEMMRYGVKTVILMNSNYYQENLNLLERDHMDIQLIDLMNLMKGEYEASH
jgi:SAM-dependent methyltransferase